MNFESAYSRFLSFITIERALSENTIAAYKRDLKELADLIATKEVEEISPADIQAFLLNLKERGWSQSSINRSTSTLRSFFKFLQREYGFSNPLSEITSPKLPHRLPKALSISEVSTIIEASWSEVIPISLRNRALIELLYGTGARVSEIVGANIGDISTIESDGEKVAIIKLKGKGSKERLVPLGEYASQALNKYLTRVRPTLDKKKGAKALFLNQKGGRLSRQSAWQMVIDAAESCGLVEKVSPHVFRHSYATHLLDGGADIRVVQELLGHSSVTTTQIYTLITIDKVRESYMTAHPRSR